MTAGSHTHRIGRSHRPSLNAAWAVAGGIAIASAGFAFILNYLLGVSAPLATGIGIAYLAFVAAVFAAMWRIRAE